MIRLWQLIISMATAVGSAQRASPPSISQVARHIAARMRLPPPSSEWRIASRSTGDAAGSAGSGRSAGTAADIAASTAATRARM
jgi:hypothetical protein